jgi:amino-acid N-acetyltransferase
MNAGPIERSGDCEASVLRPAEVADIAEIRSLLAGTNLPTADITETRAPWFIVAAEGDLLIGTVAVEPCGSFGLLRSLAVRPQARGRGIGRRLVAATEANATRAGLRGLYLLTAWAGRFFEGLGYDELERWELPEPVRLTAEFRSLCPKTAIAMMKRFV